MKPLDFPLLLDENIAPDVVQGLRTRDCDLRTAWDEGLNGRPDVDVLERATGQRRVVVTHDLAFGRSAIRAGTPFVGIIYLRPHGAPPSVDPDARAAGVEEPVAVVRRYTK